MFLHQGRFLEWTFILKLVSCGLNASSFAGTLSADASTEDSNGRAGLTWGKDLPKWDEFSKGRLQNNLL